MASKYVLIFIAISQAFAQNTLSSSSSSASSSASSSSSSGLRSSNVIVLPTQELLDAQNRLQLTMRQQSDYISQAQATFGQQSTNWLLPSSDLRSTIEQSIEATLELIKKANNYYQGANKLLTVLQSAGSDIKLEWVDRVRKLQELANTALLRAKIGAEAIIKHCAEIDADQQVYAEAKTQQSTETKRQMDLALQQLSEQMLQVGVEVAGVLQPAVGRWKSVLSTYTDSQSAISRLDEVTAAISSDLQHLRPEDIETAMSDAHRAMDDVKSLFFSYGVPSNKVRELINPSQLEIFARLTRAKSMHN